MTSWRERLEMKAADFGQCSCDLQEGHHAFCPDVEAEIIANAHLSGLAELLERVEKCLELIKEKDSAREALAALREFRTGSAQVRCTQGEKKK